MRDTDMKFSDLRCIPCEGDLPALSLEKTQNFLNQLGEGWVLNVLGHLEKTYRFKTFIEAMDFANEVAKIAEHIGHHPDFYISWGILRVEIWTHKVQGLTENDFYLAAKIEDMGTW